MKRSTFSAKIKDIKKETYVADVNGKILGRVACKIATILRGKHKPIYTPHVDCGDNVIVVNLSGLKVTGKKENQKIYFTHSGYPHGHKLLMLKDVRKKNIKKILISAVKGMLPKGPLGRQIIKNLMIYSGPKDIEGKKLVI